jgi:hypothetical protein
MESENPVVQTTYPEFRIFDEGSYVELFIASYIFNITLIEGSRGRGVTESLAKELYWNT